MSRWERLLSQVGAISRTTGITILILVLHQVSRLLDSVADDRGQCPDFTINLD